MSGILHQSSTLCSPSHPTAAGSKDPAVSPHCRLEMWKLRAKWIQCSPKTKESKSSEI